MFALTLEERKPEWTRGAGGRLITRTHRAHVKAWPSRDPERSYFVDLPKLARGVKRGPVTVNLAPGLYHVADCDERNARWILVTSKGAAVDLSPWQSQIVRDRPQLYAFNPATIPQDPGAAVEITIARGGWVCRIAGPHPRYRWERTFDVPWTSGIMGSRVYSLTPGVYEVSPTACKEGRYHVAVNTAGGWTIVAEYQIGPALAGEYGGPGGPPGFSWADCDGLDDDEPDVDYAAHLAAMDARANAARKVAA